MGYLDLGHHNNKISFFDPEFLDGVIIIYSLPLEYYFKRICWKGFCLLNFSLHCLHLSHNQSTLSVTSTSIWKTSPFRFFTDSFI
jgi:hypothetical protein